MRQIAPLSLVLGGAILLGSPSFIWGAASNPSRTFHHPRSITNRFLPFTHLKQDILDGMEGRHHVHIERSVQPGSKLIQVFGARVPALVVEDRETEDGKLSEVTQDYFAQADDGTVYYLGEDVDEYRNGRVVGHEGSWLTGIQTQKPGVLMPAHPRVGDTFRSEDVPGVTVEDDRVVATRLVISAGGVTYQNCVRIQETTSDGVEYKYYASGVGVVREQSGNTAVDLKVHRTTRG